LLNQSLRALSSKPSKAAMEIGNSVRCLGRFDPLRSLRMDQPER
jgi:hypothetical protein